MNEPRRLQPGIRDCKFGPNVTVVEPVNLYEAEFGENVFIGPFCEVQSEVTIGARTRVQSHSFVCSLVSIGSDCFIGHGTMFINDRFAIGGPARGDKTLWERTSIGNNVSIGSNSTILPVTIVDGVVVGAGSVVTTSLLEAGIYIGNPARLLRKL